MSNNFDFYENDAQPVIPIEELTLKNNDYRRVYSTTQQQQLVFMTLQPGEEIGTEHHLYTTQFLRIEQGQGLAILNGREFYIQDGDSITIPAGTEHNIINLSDNIELKLYTIYSPPTHEPGLVQFRKPLDNKYKNQ